MRKLSTKIIALAVAAVAACSLALTSGTARAAEDWGLHTFTNQGNGYCLDSNSSGSVYDLKCNGGAYQDWDLVYYGGAPQSFTLVDDATGRCLDSNFGDGATGSVYTLPCNGGAYQAWELISGYASNVFYLADEATGFYLEVNTSGGVNTYYDFTGLYRQYWKATCVSEYCTT